MKIDNYKIIADTKNKKDLLEIISCAISDSMPDLALRNVIERKDSEIFVNNKKTADLKKNRVFVIGAGKASGIMAEVFERIIGEKNIAAGNVNYKGGKPKTKKIKTILTGHPLPNEASIKGTEKILGLKEKFNIGKDDIIFCLISGGGSALLESPINGISLDDIQKTTRILLRSGANINDINAVRQELSKVKGGGLARHFYPAKIYSLIISDVIGNDLKTIASCPTVNIKQKVSAYEIINKYKLENKIPKKVLRKLQNFSISSKKFPITKNIIISDINTMINSAEKKSKDFGIKTTVLNRAVTGEVQIQAKKYAKKIIRLSESLSDKNLAFIFGGETTVTIKDECGKGGRNQEFALAFLKEMERFDKKWSFISCASDGVDFLNGVAGGIVDYKTSEISRNKKINCEDFLNAHNSYNFLKKVNGLILTKKGTGTNVCDIQICLLG